MLQTTTRQLLTLEDPIILRHSPIVRKSRYQEIKTAINVGPLRVTKIRTARGRLAYKLELRGRKYASTKDIVTLSRKLFLITHPSYKAAHNEAVKKWRNKDKEAYNRDMRDYRAENKDRINEQQRVRRRLHTTMSLH